MFKFILILAAIVILLVFVGWIGLQIKPAPFPGFYQASSSPQTIPLPNGLPAPVDRFYRTVYGDEIPVITSAVITGRASMRPAGPIALPARFRFTHEAGQNYRHYIEVTFFGLPVLRINERYLNGQSRMELPWAADEGDKVDQAANLGLWAETIWIPAVFLTDSRVRWEPLDDVTAILVVPFNQTEEQFIVRFDPETGLIEWLESMRYQTSESELKTLWLNHAQQWEPLNGTLTSLSSAAIWMNDGKPWAVFNVEDIVLNADVSDYIQNTGL